MLPYELRSEDGILYIEPKSPIENQDSLSLKSEVKPHIEQRGYS